jgi:hypothetical protein
MQDIEDDYYLRILGLQHIRACAAISNLSFGNRARTIKQRLCIGSRFEFPLALS